MSPGIKKINTNQPDSRKTNGKPRLSGGQARILVAPLDWGLGHATRCIPIIRELLALDCGVWLAGEAAQEVLLREEFPGLPFLQLEGYRARYAASAAGLLWQMLLQAPRFLQIIKNEHAWLKKMVAEYHFDAVISDNRFGLYHKKIPTVFITHQLAIKSPLGKWSERLIQKRNYSYINRFAECWIPDEEKNGLAGILSHPGTMPGIPAKYIGSLSRFNYYVEENKENNKHLLFILSGPEPQRSLLEDKIVHEIAHYNGTATIVRGLPSEKSLLPSTNMIRFYNHLPAEELEKEINKAAYVISRSGYSTIMDMAALQKKTILIPTPGQTEQEYLAEYLTEKKMALCISQKNFSLLPAIAKATSFSYQPFPVNTSDALKKTISSFIQSLPA
ncbi:MAG: glycosyl transferase family 28 [Chitinophagales bacterium]|nr:glycosyl transferase family 28 [Chitinophagales bacterium]